ncbi:EscU/YscU/HrcU family type III secretion system export apparatus switch protein [Marivivens sp. LCG002]|uniref:EscU/YscU/HrcU family type III secretion system export apparatus switch protein n=1 Tax=Marivivens sp. LCG002 TaxID=3051171 RepID=UPI0025562523|nr:EscU/YscU/HrcU family type III secretion system export apparatus switch protein [Marivivens sp. LCG002]WIV51280.1 EscU/YscU/HrcU family type III secretion system export apparatus switch protein [Marivivens sp. LCG002]
MAENEDGQEKTDEPTPRRKEQAREDGKVVTSKEVFVFASMAVGTLMIVITIPFLTDIAAVWASYLDFERAADLDSFMLHQLGEAWRHLLLIGLASALPIGLTVLGVQAAMGGLQFAPKALGFKFEKLNPGKGLARMVSKQALVDLGKAVIKVLLLGALAWSVLLGMMPRIDTLWADGAGTALSVIFSDITWLLAAMTIGLAAIGGIDLVWQIRSLNESLMMTKQEVKEEMKDQNGSPELKGKIRQKQFEASQRGAKQRGALDQVPHATAVVTNPQHFAVAMRYVHGEMDAPVVLASGKGPIAQEIKRRAKEARVQTIELPPLARALYFTTEIGNEVDPRLYAAVAALLSHVYLLDRGELPDLPDIILPEELRFDEFGNKENR